MHTTVNVAECEGTNTGNAVYGGAYEFYRDRYVNCTEVTSNLEIAGLRSSGFDLSFLENIRIVHGYVLIYNVWARRVPLTSLRVIRGKQLYGHRDANYSLFVFGNVDPKSSERGLEQLWLSSLTGMNFEFSVNGFRMHEVDRHWLSRVDYINAFCKHVQRMQLWRSRSKRKMASVKHFRPHSAGSERFTDEVVNAGMCCVIYSNCVRQNGSRACE
jgi:hypothetical protein